MINISIILPIYNSEPTLWRCLESIRRESASDSACETICVDNGSRDGSLEIVRAFPEVTLLHETKPGAYAARNLGAAAARGRFLAFTDPDCVLAWGWLRAALDTLRDETCLVVLGVRRPAPDTGLNRLLGDYEVTKDRFVISSQQPLKYYGYTNTMSIRREAWDRFGPFDDRSRGSDTIFVRRVVDGAGCAAVKFVPAMEISHLEIDGPLTYLKKAFIYGRSLQSYRRTVVSKPLTFRDRWQVFLATAKENNYGPIRSVALAVLLLSGMGAWSLGRLAGRLAENKNSLQE